MDYIYYNLLPHGAWAHTQRDVTWLLSMRLAASAVFTNLLSNNDSNDISWSFATAYAGSFDRTVYVSYCSIIV